MPRTSERMRIVQMLEILAIYQELFPEDGGSNNVFSERFFDDTNAAELLASVNASRYLVLRILVPKNRYWLEEGLARLDEKGFRQQMSVSRE